MTEANKYIIAEELALTIFPKGKATHHPDPLALVCLIELLVNWKDTPWATLAMKNEKIKEMESQMSCSEKCDYPLCSRKECIESPIINKSNA